MDNYPDGTWSGDPRAPWNEPDPDAEPEWRFDPKYGWVRGEVEEEWQSFA